MSIGEEATGANAADHASFVQHGQNGFGIHRGPEGKLVEEARRQDFHTRHSLQRVRQVASGLMIQQGQLFQPLAAQQRHMRREGQRA